VRCRARPSREVGATVCLHQAQTPCRAAGASRRHLARETAPKGRPRTGERRMTRWDTDARWRSPFGMRAKTGHSDYRPEKETVAVNIVPYCSPWKITRCCVGFCGTIFGHVLSPSCIIVVNGMMGDHYNLLLLHG